MEILTIINTLSLLIIASIFLYFFAFLNKQRKKVEKYKLEFLNIISEFKEHQTTQSNILKESVNGKLENISIEINSTLKLINTNLYSGILKNNELLDIENNNIALIKDAFNELHTKFSKNNEVSETINNTMNLLNHELIALHTDILNNNKELIETNKILANNVLENYKPLIENSTNNIITNLNQIEKDLEFNTEKLNEINKSLHETISIE